MKKLMTRLMAVIAIFFLSASNVNALVHPITNGEVFECLQTNITGSNWVTYTYAGYTSRTACVTGLIPNLSGTGRVVVFNVSGCESFTIYVDGSPTTRYLTYSINSGTAVQTLAWPSGCTNQTFTTGNTGDITISIAGVSGSVYLGKVVFYTPTTPTITSFVANGISATINQAAKTITAELTYGTDLSNILPVVTIGGLATSYLPTEAQNFSNSVAVPVIFKAVGTPSNVDYAVTLTVPATLPAPILNLSSGSSTQTVKAVSAITDIVYTLTNATGANVTGLPNGLNGNFVLTGTNAGTYTISGTVNSGISAGAFNFIVTAIPIVGYTGDPTTTTGAINLKNQDASDILYLATDATTPANDLFLAQLLAKPIFVVVKRSAQVSFTGNYDPYELIVLHESLTGGDAATVGHELNLIKAVDKPILNLKSYFYSTGRWSWGTPNNGNSGRGIAVKQPTHPIFSGITYTDSIYMYGSLRAKNIQPVVLSVGGFEIANVEGGVAIHDLPASIRIPTGSSKYLMVSLLNGAFNDLTADALTLLDNAVNYLLSGSQFLPTGIGVNTVDNLNISFDGQTVLNPDNQNISVYDVIGRLIISSNRDINLKTHSNGIYFVKGEKGLLKVSVIK